MYSHGMLRALTDCLYAGIPGSDLHQFLPAALYEVCFLRQLLSMQGRTKQPEENLLLFCTETLAACSRKQEERAEGMK